MAMVNVVTIAAYRRIYWPRLIGLVQRSAATWAACYIRQMNRVNSRSDSALLWRQHHKHCRGYYYYYYLRQCCKLSCHRNWPHYWSCSSVRPSVRPARITNVKTTRHRKSNIRVTGVPVLNTNSQRSNSQTYHRFCWIKTNRRQRRGSESYWPVRRLIHRPQMKTGSVWSRRQTSKWCTGKPDPSNLYQDEGWWPALAGVQTCQWSTTHHLDPPDLSWHGCYSDRGPAASGGQTVLANNRNDGRLRLIASRHYYYY